MKRLYMFSTFLFIIMMTACTGKQSEAATGPGSAAAETDASEIRITVESKELPPEEAVSENEALEDSGAMRIRVQGDGKAVVFKLNDSPAARSLYSQLPLKTEVENYSDNEKIFRPAGELEIGDTPLTDGGEEGGLAYFAPWKNVVMYYGSFGPYSGLYDLGEAISGGEWIEELSGEILIEAAEGME